MDNFSFAANWHTHNYRCKHATGDFVDYARAAQEAGILVLGISDHSPFPDNRDCGVRMLYSEFSGYVEGFRAARAAVPEVELHLGVELEYYRDLMPDYPKHLLKSGLEYIVGATHFFCLPDGIKVSSWHVLPESEQPRHALAYGDFVAEMIRSGLYAFIAHPDLIGCFCDRWLPECEEAAHKIGSTARECGIPLEINMHGFSKAPIFDPGEGGMRQKYPWDRFWKTIAAERATVILNSDAHEPDRVAAHLEDALALCNRCGLRPTVFTGVSGNRLCAPL